MHTCLCGGRDVFAPATQVHNYVKQARFDGRADRLLKAWGLVVDSVAGTAGKTRDSPGTLQASPADGLYHIVGCDSPEYFCYPPFGSLACKPQEDCNYGLSQLRWGLSTALELTSEFGLSGNLSARGVDAGWWQALVGVDPILRGEAAGGELAW
jgi:hypothetical protein